MITGVWMISISIGAPILGGINDTEYQVADTCSFFNPTYIFLSTIGSFLLPAIVIISLYARIMRTLGQRAKIIREKQERLAWSLRGRDVNRMSEDVDVEPESSSSQQTAKSCYVRCNRNGESTHVVIVADDQEMSDEEDDSTTEAEALLPQESTASNNTGDANTRNASTGDANIGDAKTGDTNTRDMHNQHRDTKKTSNGSNMTSRNGSKQKKTPKRGGAMKSARKSKKRNDRDRRAMITLMAVLGEHSGYVVTPQQPL